MAARRCSTCSINYGLGIYTCPRCGSKTWHLNEENPDAATQSAPSDDEEYELVSFGDALYYDAERQAKVIAWRYVMFQCMGFAEGDARLLSERRDVDSHAVNRMLLAGASHEQARDIVL